jgi:pimeloyl-ACP methyl ester carboxylesterase
LVFIHGGNGSAFQWETLIPSLLREYTCIAIELRGHGRSDRSPEAAFGAAAMIEEATAFVEQVVGVPMALVGQSMGGGIAFAIAGRRPELVRGVYGEDALPAGYPTERIPEFMKVFFANVGRAVGAQHADGLSFLQFAALLGENLPTMASSAPGRSRPFCSADRRHRPGLVQRCGEPGLSAFVGRSKGYHAGRSLPRTRDNRQRFVGRPCHQRGPRRTSPCGNEALDNELSNCRSPDRAITHEGRT